MLGNKTESDLDHEVRPEHLETPETTLLKYEEEATQIQGSEFKKSQAHNINRPISAATLGQHGANPKLAKHHESSKRVMMEVLNLILPPKEWEEGGKFYKQKVSTQPADVEDVRQLNLMLDLRLKERCAREKGFCPIRRELYTQVFDEIIRQVTLESPARAVLIRRMRDELRITLYCYKYMNESSESHANRKNVMVEASKKEIDRVIAENEESLQEKRNYVEDLKTKLKAMEAQYKQMAEDDAKKRIEAMEFYKGISSQLKKQVERMKFMPGKRN